MGGRADGSPRTTVGRGESRRTPLDAHGCPTDDGRQRASSRTGSTRLTFATSWRWEGRTASQRRRLRKGWLLDRRYLLGGMDDSSSGRVAVEFESESAMLRGFLYPATHGEPPFPLVVMAHGFSATIRMVADRYAEALADAGVSALLYDHRNLGMSDGEPRQEINPWVQCRGYRDAITFASTLDRHDTNRIGLWGDSYSAGEVFVVAACDPRVRVVVAQCPVFGRGLPSIGPSRQVFAEICDTFESGDVSGIPEDVTGPIPVVSPDQLRSPSLLEPIQAFRWFVDYGGRPGSGWLNQTTRIIPSNTAPYSPYLCAPFVRIPSLMMVAPQDEMVQANPQVSRAAFGLLEGDKEWCEIDGGHFGLLYHPSELFDEATSVQAAFLSKHLLP